ncbi:hypothetical protein CI610_03328 [invertebrate metagenome]|uniref:Uncharacterized protein n=1 Tax=invertebrate metagenome TaxID=1711999 RepID=A0A2H9T3D1_9ZZZZ
MKVKVIHFNKLGSPLPKHATDLISTPWDSWLLRRSRLKILAFLTPVTLNEDQGHSFEQTCEPFTPACYRPNIRSLGLLVIEKKLLKFLAFLTAVTLNEGQGHSIEQTW